MARVTVEDCIDKVENRFELVMVASQRARKIGTGAELTVDRDNDKNTVVALREIAGETISVEDMKEELIRTRQKVIHVAEDDEELIDLMSEDFDANEMETDQLESSMSPTPLESPLSDMASES